MLRKGFKLIFELRPRLFPLGVCMAVLRALTPFINIFMTAQILNELLGARNLQTLTVYVLVTVLLNWFLGLASERLVHSRNEQMIPIWVMQTHLLSKKLMDMDYPNLEDPHTHQLEQSVYALCMYMGRTLWSLQEQVENMISGLITVVVSVGMTASLFFSPAVEGLTGFRAFAASPWFSILLVGLILLSVFLSMRMNIKKNEKIIKLVEDEDFNLADRLSWHYQSYLEDYKSGKDVRLYNQGGLIMGKIWQSAGLLSAGMNREGNLTGRYNSLQAALSTLVGGLVYLFVALKALLGVLSIGSVVQYTGSITQFVSGFTLLMTNFSQLRSMAADFGVFFEFMELPDGQAKGTLPIEKQEGGEYVFELRNVSFAYPGVEEYALKDVSMKFRAGERLAVVGLNGSGKTTLIKLLCRLYDPQQGEILLNGVDIREYDYTQYQALFSVVFQDYKLFSLPVGENVAASMEYEEEKVEACLKEAGLEEWVQKQDHISRLPLYKDCFDNGIEISGGEAQKVAIARALYKDAPFVILDEPTAALDPVSESEIYARFDTMIHNKSAIYISHRLSSCRFCDDIAVFDQGRLIQRGNHEELLADTNGRYYELWNAQAQYYQKNKKAPEPA